MKKLASIVTLLLLSIYSYGQQIDSLQFSKLYNGLTETYTRNIDSYLIELAESEFLAESNNSSKEVQLKPKTAVDNKVNAYRKVLKNLFSENYLSLSKDLTLLGESPRSYVVGYLDMSIRSHLPGLNSGFFKKNWKDVIKLDEG